MGNPSLKTSEHPAATPHLPAIDNAGYDAMVQQKHRQTNHAATAIEIMHTWHGCPPVKAMLTQFNLGLLDVKPANTVTVVNTLIMRNLSSAQRASGIHRHRTQQV